MLKQWANHRNRIKLKVTKLQQKVLKQCQAVLDNIVFLGVAL